MKKESLTIRSLAFSNHLADSRTGQMKFHYTKICADNSYTDIK